MRIDDHGVERVLLGIAALGFLQFEQMSRRFAVDQAGEGIELDVALAFVELGGGESTLEAGQVKVDGVFGGMKVVFGALLVGGRFQVSVKPGVENIETACRQGAGIGRGVGGIGRRGEGDGCFRPDCRAASRR